MSETRIPLSATFAFPAVLLLFISAAQAQAPQKSVVPKGSFRGLWAGHRVVFNIQQVHKNTFDGIAEHVEGRFKGLKFGIHGKLSKDRSLVMTRYVAGDTQIARSGPPRSGDGQLTWLAETNGFGIPEEGSWLFRLSIPEKK